MDQTKIEKIIKRLSENEGLKKNLNCLTYKLQVYLNTKYNVL